MTGCRLTLLGGFALRTKDGEPIEIGMRKAKALLAWLALRQGEPHSRDKLAGLLWAESGDAAARHSLRQALSNLRRGLPDPERMLLTAGDRLQLAAGSLDCDVPRFWALSGSDNSEDLEQALTLYRGELLEGFNVRSPEFEDWVTTERSGLREQACSVLQRVLSHYVSEHAWEQALRVAVRLLSLEPLREPIVRQAMELELRLGRQAEALRRYRSFQARLRHELAVAPEPETRDLYRRILARRAARSPSAQPPVIGDKELAPQPPRSHHPRDPAGGESVIETTSKLPSLPGRACELRQIEGALSSCLEIGMGSVLLVRGEAGIGKSALVDAAASLASTRGYAVHHADVFQARTDATTASAASLIRGLLPAQEGARGIRSDLEAACADRDDAVFLLDALGEPLSTVEKLFFRSLDLGEQRQGLCRALRHLLAFAVRERPRLLLVEDIHWAPRGLLAVLAALSVEVTRLPALLLLTSRNKDEPFDPDWRGAMQGTALTTLELGRLDTKTAMELVRRHGIADRPWSHQCIERAAGHPLFLEHLLRAGPESSEALPSSVAALVQRQLAGLPVADRQAVQTAAVLGQRFSVSALERLVQQGPAWAVLEASGLLCREGDWARFTHALVREGVLDGIPEPTHRALHLRAAGIYRVQDSVLFADHLVRARDPAAAEACLAAARDCLGRHRYDAAIDLAKSALSTTDVPAQRGQVGLFLGELHRGLGEVETALSVLARTIEEAADDAVHCDAQIEFAATLLVQDRYAEALERLSAVQPTAESIGDPARLARLMLQLGNAHFALGQVESCMRAQQAALAAANAADAPELRARALSGLGDAHYQRGRMITAHHYFDRCVRLCESEGLVRLHAPNLSGRAMSVMYLNRMQDAMSDAANAVRLSTLVRNRRDECLARNVLAIAAYYAGDLELAENESEAGLVIAREVGLRRFEADHLTMLGATKNATGQRRGALQHLEAAWELVRSTDLAYAGPCVLGYLAQASDDAERRRECLTLAESALDGNSLSHNHFQFRYSAIEIAIAAQDPDAVVHHAAALETYTAEEPLPWSELVASSARTLATSLAAASGPQPSRRLTTLAAEAQAAGLVPLYRLLQSAVARLYRDVARF